MEKYKNFINNKQWLKLFKKEPFYAFAGYYYGYPICCVEHLINNRFKAKEIFDNFKNKNKREFFSDGSGFVPCNICIEKNEKTTYDYIIKNRVCSEDFTKHLQNDFIKKYKLKPKFYNKNYELNMDDDFYEVLKLIYPKTYKKQIKHLSFITYIYQNKLQPKYFLKIKDKKINITAPIVVMGYSKIFKNFTKEEFLEKSLDKYFEKLLDNVFKNTKTRFNIWKQIDKSCFEIVEE